MEPLMKSAMFLIWVVDALVKVLPTTPPPARPETTVRIECARNEYESGQLVFRAQQAVKALTVKTSELKQEEGNGAIAAANVRARFVGMVPLAMNTNCATPEKLIAKAPAAVPDVLLEKPSIAVPANVSQPVWITLYVPKGTPAGKYQGTVELDADGAKQAMPLEVTVYNYEIPDQRHLFVTNWINVDNWAKHHKVEAGTEAYWELIATYAREIAAHRQNVFMVNWRMIGVTREGDGRFTYDYSKFDRFIETFLKAGTFDRIEISFVATFEKDWSSKNIVLLPVSAADRATGKTVRLPAEEALGPLLAALERHLDEKGWLERAMIHVADEASMHNIESYRKASAFVHKHAPRLRRIDAIETVDYDGALEVWVPKISHLYHWLPWYQQAQREGNELWFYVCNQPRGMIMNRYMDYPLIETRLLQWLHVRYGTVGYLHWGFSAWKGDPFGPQGTSSLPPGDTHTAYPGERGPLSSIRWEAERDGIEDYESFRLLEARQREAAGKLGTAAQRLDPARRSRELCQRIVRSFIDYSENPEELREARRTLAREIEQAATEPLVIWETLPDEQTPLVPEPASPVVIHGATRPGTTVKVNGQAVEAGADGHFMTDVRANTRQAECVITLEAEKGAETKTQSRRLAISK